MFGSRHIQRIRGWRPFACVAAGRWSLPSCAVMVAALAAITIAGWSAQLAPADTFVWAGTCGTPYWSDECYEGPCGDQGAYAFYCNNWGRCDCSDDPEFYAVFVYPGTGDDVVLGTSTVTADGVCVNSLRSAGALSVEYLGVGSGGAVLDGTCVIGGGSFSGPLTTTGTTTIGGLYLDNGIVWENSGEVHAAADDFEILKLGSEPGTFDNAEKGIFEFDGGDNGYLQVDALFTNEGRIYAHGGWDLSFIRPFTSIGTVNIGAFGMGTYFGMGADFQGGTLAADGVIFGDVCNSGATFAPGTPESFVDIYGSYTQGPAGTLVIDIASESSYGSLQMWDASIWGYGSGTATLDGTLLINLVDGFTTPPGQTYFFVLGCDNRIGTFADVILPPDVPAAVEYGPSYVTVVLSSLTGACCYSSGDCVDALEADCTGGWFGAGTACDSSADYCAPGACCHDDGSCEEVFSADCTGIWVGSGSTCSMGYCSPAACCYADGRCEDLVPFNCAGEWLGPYTTCSTSPCTGPGACCYSGGCADTLFTDCTGEYAFWFGAGTSCSTNPCAGPGACCIADGSCRDGLFASSCAAAGGTFQGGGIACAGVQCEQGPPTAARGDLNCDGAVNVFDIDPFVLAIASAPDFTAYHAAYPGCDGMLGDVNCDGVVNVFDIDPFVVCIAGGGCPPCP